MNEKITADGKTCYLNKCVECDKNNVSDSEFEDIYGYGEYFCGLVCYIDYQSRKGFYISDDIRISINDVKNKIKILENRFEWVEADQGMSKILRDLNESGNKDTFSVIKENIAYLRKERGCSISQVIGVALGALCFVGASIQLLKLIGL